MPSLGSPNDSIANNFNINHNHNNNNNNIIKINHRHSTHLPLTHQNYSCSRRYAEIGAWRRGDAFLEPYMEGLGREDTKPGVRSLTSSPVLNLQDNRRVSPQFTILDLQSDHRQSSIDQVDGVCGEEESADETSGGSSAGSGCGDTPPCDIGLMERLIRSHPVWFLPGIQRAGAFHLLQGKEEGNFVVRQSSQSSTMAISVRLPAGKGPYIEHYLIQAAPDGQLSLESSENKFSSIPGLIAHYCQCCDELPVQLTLPRAIRDAKNRQQLSSLALLGQEFWRYPMANPRPTQSTSEPSTQQVSESTTGLNSSLPSSQASSLSSFGSGNNNNAGRSPTGEPDSIVLNLTPLADHNQPSSLLSTFKGSSQNESNGAVSPKSDGSCESPPIGKAPVQRAPRPTPPNTLNLSTLPASGPNSNCKSVSSPPSSLGVIPAKTPPPPPPRWSKPAPNFTVTTTVTFSMTETSSSSPLPNQIEAGTNSKQGSICDSESLPSLASGTATLESNRGTSVKSPMSEPTGQVLSPVGSDTRSSLLSPISDSKPPHRRSKRHKESRHYQESDILESPGVYYRSSVADKVSDYEDIWGPESMTTFKPRSSPFTSPDEVTRRVPDILDRIPPCPMPRPSVTSAPVTPHPSPLTPPEPQTPTEQAPTNTKQSSPFYCEPADAIKSAALEVTRRRNRTTHRNNRHSDPATLSQWPSIAPHGVLERIDSKEELSLAGLSSSVDNLVGPKRLGRRIGILERGKSKPKVAKRPQGKHSETWAVDSSWEFIGNEEEPQSEQEEPVSPEESFASERKFPPLEQDTEPSPGSRGITIQELISKRCPEIAILTDLTAMRSDAGKSDSSGNSGSRVSAYDNVTNQQTNGASTLSHISDDDTQTIFSEPWDSSRWETLLERGDDWQRGEERVNMVRTKSFRERLDPFLCAPRLAALQRTKESGGTGASIRSYTLQLAADKTTVFAQTIDNFISCTRESKETRPQVVMRNMRQFMTGMKNYLVTHGEREFERQVEKERNKLKSTEFLNLDAILEGVMHKLVVRPLKEHLYKLFVDEYTDTGAIQLLAENIKYARTKHPKDIGIRPNIILPSEEAMDEICSTLQLLQDVDSPLEKLDRLLNSIASIFKSVKVSNSKGGMMLGADDFLPLFVWVLVQSGMVAAEIEADYMWGLLHPSLLSGEGGYYLTTLSSAVHVLKSFRSCSEEFTASGASLNWGTGSGPLAEFRSVLKIVVPDERNGSILTKTLPIRPNMTTKDVCKIIAHKVRITNPQDYALYKLIDGDETILADSECPQDIKGNLSDSGKHCMFAYKRIDAKIAWPKNTSQ